MLDGNQKQGTQNRCRPWLAALSLMVAAVGSIGCQTTVGGQTLPSAYYLRDDVQFFPAGPEFLLSNQHAALDEYRLEQQQQLDGPADAAP